MYIFKNAVKNLGRNRGRNLLLGGTMLAIVISTVVTLTITRTTDAIIADYKQQFLSEIFIELDMDAFIANMMAEMTSEGGSRQHSGGGVMVGGGIPALDSQLILDIVDSPYLADYQLQATVGINSRDLQALDSDDPDFLNFIENQPSLEIDDDGRLLMLNENDEMTISPMLGIFSIEGGNWADFELGERALTHGEMPVNYGEALISGALAEKNNLSIGDTFEVNHFLTDEDHYITREFVITGLYVTLEADDGLAFMMMGRMPFMNRDNEILTTFDTAIFPALGGSSIAQISGSYFLHNPSDLDTFESSIRNLGLTDDFIVRTDEASYQAIVAPVVGLGNVTQTFLWVVLILGGIIITLLSSIAIRERKYEIGVLRAMGMKKGKIATGLASETLMITALCLVLGLGVGTILSQPITDALLTVQLEAIPEIEDTGFGGFGGGGVHLISSRGGGGVPEVSPIDELNVVMSASTIVEIVVLSLSLSAVASVISLAKITKYEPIKILMERN